MKQDIRPNYQPVIFMGSTTGSEFSSGPIKGPPETIEWEDGSAYPLLRVEVTSDSHPPYTSRQKFTQADGCADHFNKKYSLKDENTSPDA